MQAVAPRRLNREQIAALIPHGGAMVLLDSIEDWGPAFIDARTLSHRDAANPLRRAGRLHAVARACASACALPPAACSAARTSIVVAMLLKLRSVSPQPPSWF